MTLPLLGFSRKICVLGAGVVGLYYAYYLVKKGFRVLRLQLIVQPGVVLRDQLSLIAGQISPGLFCSLGLLQVIPV